MADSRKQQVSLRGSSAKEISRDALLQRVSQERQLRDYSRRASAAALFIQKIWRRYIVTKKAAVEVQQEWETLVISHNVSITKKWISSSLLRPFLFFVTCPSAASQKQQTTNRRCMLICFKIMLQSINSTESEKNFCCLAVGAPEERCIWLHQAQKLILICLSLLAEFSCSAPGDQYTSFLTALAMRIVVALIDLKGWVCITSVNLKDADIAVKDLIKCISTGKHHLYSSIRSYIIKLNYPAEGKSNCGPQTDDHFLITASAITIALRPFQVVKSDADNVVNMEVQDVVEQYCVYLLTIPWLFQRLPTILLSALKHESVLSPCLKTLLVDRRSTMWSLAVIQELNWNFKLVKLMWSISWSSIIGFMLTE